MMASTILFLSITVVLVLTTSKKNSNQPYTFMSRTQTDILRGLAILMVMLMHLSCNQGGKIFTPLGG